MSSSTRSLRAFGLRFLTAMVACTLVAVAGLAYLNYRVNQDIANIPRTVVKTDKSLGPGKPANYLVIGSDTRSFVKSADDIEGFGNPNDQTGQRSDTIMIVHVEPQNKRTIVMSIPRDTWVNIPGVGNYKINAAFNKDLGGGPDKLIETIKANFDIPIQHYVEVDFQSFQGIVDAVGTVPVYFDTPARDTVTGLVIDAPGCQQLKGDMALAYVRSRHYEKKVNGRWREDPTGDLGRIERQQDFMRRLGSKAIQSGINNPITAKALLDKTLKQLTVDDSFDSSDAYRLINSFRGVDPNDSTRISLETLPGEGAMRNGQSVLVLKQPEANEMLAKLRTFDNAPPASTTPATPAGVKVRVLNSSGQTGVAATAATALGAAGFQNVATGNGSTRMAQTTILYAPGAEAKANLVAAYFGAGVSRQADPSVSDVDVEVVLGQNFKGVVSPTAATAAPGSTGTTAAPPPDPAAAC